MNAPYHAKHVIVTNQAVESPEQQVLPSVQGLNIRNQILGVITNVQEIGGGVALGIDIGCGNQLTSFITVTTQQDVGLQIGDTVVLSIPPTNIFVLGYGARA